MIKVQLFIDSGKINDVSGLIEPNWLLADTPEKENITIKDSIKKSKDVGKVFTAYTNPFKMPASKRNNIIFKRFSNNKVYDGFDPRRKYSARIQLNGVDFKKGYVKLNKVDLSDNLPVTYNVQFFGELVSLKDILGDSKLDSLQALNKYTFPYNHANTQLGSEVGFDVIVNTISGSRHVDVISVDTAPITTGDITINLNGVDYSTQITGKMTAEYTANQISDFINSLDGYATGLSGDRVTVFSDGNGLQSTLTVSVVSATLMSVTVVNIQAGSNDTQSNENVTISENPNGMIKFPLLSHTRGFEYTDTVGDQQGFHRILSDEEKQGGWFDEEIGEIEDNPYPVKPADRLNRFDLKPALKLPYIFEAIEEQFTSIRFNKDWLFGENGSQKSPIKDMYLWLHRKKGFLGGDFTSSKILRNAGASTSEGEWYFNPSPNSDFRPFIDTSNNVAINWSGTLSVRNIVGTGDITLEVYVYEEGTNALFGEAPFIVTGSSSEGQINCDFSFPFQDFNEALDNRQHVGSYYIETKIIANEGVGQVYPELVMIRESSGGSGVITAVNNYTYNGNLEVFPNINIQSNMPDYKCIDFLSDLFKMYNLVAYEQIQDDGSYIINIESYDYYISNGFDYDITKYIDISKGSVERISPYSRIDYKFSKPKTFLAINQKEITGDDFGNASFNVSKFTEAGVSTESLLFDGGKYEVAPKLEKIMYERVKTYPLKENTNIQWGWFVNDNKENVPEPVIGKPLYMFTNQKVIGTPLSNPYPIKWETGDISNKIVTPSSVINDGSQTLHFNAEFDEFTGEINKNSLFKNYHDNYIAGIYSSYAKKIKVDAYLPPLMFTKLKLNDTIIVDNISYFIDEMDINITTSKTKFSLLRVTDIKTRLESKPKNQVEWEKDKILWNTEESVWSDVGRESTDYAARVINDGGILESEKCINYKLQIQ